MKVFRKLTALAGVLFAALLLGANVLVLRMDTRNQKLYQVEISRAGYEIAEKGLENLNLEDYPHLICVSAGEGKDFLEGGDQEYVLREIDGVLYRFDYLAQSTDRNKILLILNGCLLGEALLVIGILLYLRRQIVGPFERVSHLPEELAKGNLTMPVMQQKSRYLGNFLWGMDLLREKLERQKQQELKLQKEKKSLLLSLAHDLKTPLAAIKLYAQALGRNLYRETEKQQKIYGKIEQKADQIEAYLGQIIEASQEDFLHLEVVNQEFYLEEIKKSLFCYYQDKLQLLKISCTMDFGENCLLKGDRDRCEEILQNLMENAIKYGGGGEIILSAREEGDCRILTVTSGNCTLSREELPHIFDSFWRGSNSENIPGSGLGLFICRQLARAMGGDIFAQLKDNKMEVSLVLLKV